MNLAVWLDRQARATPERPALFWGKDAVATYGQFARSCGRIADWLRANAVLPGDRVAVFMKNQPDYLRLIYGIWQAGAVQMRRFEMRSPTQQRRGFGSFGCIRRQVRVAS